MIDNRAELAAVEGEVAWLTKRWPDLPVPFWKTAYLNFLRKKVHGHEPSDDQRRDRTKGVAFR
jgi:hypothetical protein